MARQTRPVHIQVLARGDYIDIKGFGDCKVLKADTRLSKSLDIARIWAVSPRSQIINVCLPSDALVNLVEIVTDDNPDVEETIQTVMPIALRRGDTFYFGPARVTSLTSGIKHPGAVHFMTESGKEFKVSISTTLRLRRVVTTRKAKPLSFSEFALSTYDKALERLAKAVLSREVSRETVEAEPEDRNIITTKDVPAPVKPERPMTCTDIIAELEEVRLHDGDLPVSIMNPEDGYRHINVCGAMVENLYPWASRTGAPGPGTRIPSPEAPLRRPLSSPSGDQHWR